MQRGQQSSHRMAFVLVWTLLLVWRGTEAKGKTDCSRCGMLSQESRDREAERDGEYVHMLPRPCAYICLCALLNTLAPCLVFPAEHLLPPLAVLLGNPCPTCGPTQSGSQRDSSRHLFSFPGSAGGKQNPFTILLLICLLDSISDPNEVFAEGGVREAHSQDTPPSLVASQPCPFSALKVCTSCLVTRLLLHCVFTRELKNFIPQPPR